MRYHQYDIDHFVHDPFFREWILHPTPASNYFWEKWLLKHPDKEKTITEARIIIQTLQFKEGQLTNVQKSELLKRIKDTNARTSKISQDKTIVRPLHDEYREISLKNRRVRHLNIRYYAAVIAGLLMIAASVFWLNKDAWQASDAKIAMVEKENPKGQKSRIFLPDGSTVLLNASSKLTYPSQFTGNTREVHLAGEAFFEVVKDTTQPFFVRTDNLVTKVLGTSFNVKAFDNKNEQSVALLTGKVEIFSERDKENKVVLIPGELAGYVTQTGELVKRKYDYNEEILWKDGVLYFKETPLEEVLYRLEQWYGVDFIVENMPDKEYPVTGRFEKEYLNNVLQSISFSVKFAFEIDGNEVHLSF